MENMEGIPLSEIPRKRALLKPDMQDVNKFEERLSEIRQTPEESHGGNPYPNEYLDEDAFFALRNFFDGIGDIQTAADTLREDNYYSEQATEMQQMMMESISRNNRVRIEGVAGSGKSRMVIWEALRLSKIGKSVAIACYNDLLAEELREDVENALAKERKIVTDKYGRDGGVGFGKIEVNVYADWCKKYAKAVKELPKMGADKSQYYDKELPHAFSNAQVKLFKDKKLREKMFFDAVIIDEAQDFASEWIDTLIGLLRDKERGFARVFYDPAQRLYANRDGIENVQVKAMPVMVLKRGFRNTKKILEWIYKNTNIRLQSYNNTPQGTSVKEYRYKDVSEEEQLLINSYNELERKYSVKPSEVLVVSMRSEARSGIKNIKDDRFVWNKVGGKKLIQDKVNIVSAYRIKGLDTMAVILVDVEEPTETSKREDWKRLLLVGATRAKKLLTVIRKKA
jgi:superfamily I DNA/RNA helicase